MLQEVLAPLARSAICQSGQVRAALYGILGFPSPCTATVGSLTRPIIRLLASTQKLFQKSFLFRSQSCATSGRCSTTSEHCRFIEICLMLATTSRGCNKAPWLNDRSAVLPSSPTWENYMVPACAPYSLISLTLLMYSTPPLW